MIIIGECAGRDYRNEDLLICHFSIKIPWENNACWHVKTLLIYQYRKNNLLTFCDSTVHRLWNIKRFMVKSWEKLLIELKLLIFFVSSHVSVSLFNSLPQWNIKFGKFYKYYLIRRMFMKPKKKCNPIFSNQNFRSIYIIFIGMWATKGVKEREILMWNRI